jgi:hypothetical protein
MQYVNIDIKAFEYFRLCSNFMIGGNLLIMNRTKVKEFVRNHVPNTPFFQKLLARARLRELSVYDEIEKKVLNSKEKENPNFRSKILKECLNKWPEKAAQVRKIAQEKFSLSADYSGKEVDSKILDDVVFSYFALGFSPDEFIYYKFEKRTINERMEFLSNKLKAKYHSHFDNLIDSSVFTDKYLTYLKFKDFFRREIAVIENENDYSGFEAFVGRHPKYVKKDVYEGCGRSIELVDSANCGKTIKQQFDEMVAGLKYVVEELIIQSKDMAQFNSSSVNTVRCITMVTKKGVNVPFGFLRIGAPGSFVDNAGSGGICCAIDMATGQVITDGFDEKGYHYSAHPESGIVFKGYKLPEWDQLLLLANKVASELPGVKTIGWDFAHTNKGWVIVEGNAMSQIEVLQIPMQRGMRKDFEQYFREMEPLIKYSFE